jgi:hypothetical protein
VEPTDPAFSDRTDSVCPTVLIVAEQDPPKSGDESWTTYTPPTTTSAPDTAEPKAGELPPTHVPYGNSRSDGGTYPPAPGSTSVTVISSELVGTRSSKGCGLVATIIMLVVFLPGVFGVIAGIKAISGGFDQLNDGLGSPFSGADKVNLRTAAGFETLLDAVRAETGGTTVFEASLYGEYAGVYIPADPTSKRYYSYHYDGELRKTSQGSTDYTRFDMSTIDSSVIAKLFKRARTLIEDPKMTYVIIRSPSESDQEAWFSVHASNEFMESGYFTADKTGKVVFQYISE